MFAFLAGFVDAVAGGGGLIQVPALLVLFPNFPIPALFGTNKLSSIAGTGVALLRYAREIELPWRKLFGAALLAFVFAYVGAQTITVMDPEVAKPLVFGLLVVVAIYTFLKRDLGLNSKLFLSRSNSVLLFMLLAALLGFYDGFFGPGTGTFLILGFVVLLRQDFLTASANTKAINFATNAAALISFIASSNVIYKIAIPMAFCNLMGGYLGSSMAILKGSPFIKRVFQLVVIGLIARLAYDLVGK